MEKTIEPREKNQEVESKSYTLRTENGHWLAQIVITSDGMFSSVTDWGNFSFAWRSFGEKSLDNFKKFLTELDVSYFGTKIFTGMSYVLHTRKCEAACHRFAGEILPALQLALQQELKTDNPQPITQNR